MITRHYRFGDIIPQRNVLLVASYQGGHTSICLNTDDVDLSHLMKIVSAEILRSKFYLVEGGGSIKESTPFSQSQWFPHIKCGSGLSWNPFPAFRAVSSYPPTSLLPSVNFPPCELTFTFPILFPQLRNCEALFAFPFLLYCLLEILLRQ